MFTINSNFVNQPIEIVTDVITAPDVDPEAWSEELEAEVTEIPADVTGSPVIDVAGIPVRFNSTGRSIFVNVQNTLGNDWRPTVTVRGWANARGAMNALRALDDNQFAIKQVGFYCRQSADALAKKGCVMDAAYITAGYTGTNPTLLRLRPESGVRRLNYMMGSLVVAPQGTVLMPDMPHIGESDNTTHNRAAYWLYMALDMILFGIPMHVVPFYTKPDPNGECWPDSGKVKKVYDGQRAERDIALLAAQLQMTPEQKAADRQQRIGNLVEKRNQAKSFAAVSAGAVSSDPCTKVGVWTGTDEKQYICFEDLMGKIITYHRPGVAANVGRNNKVTENNIRGLVEYVVSRRLLVEVIQTV